MISSGYDSTAVSVLVKELGIEVCFTSHRSNSLIPPWISGSAAIDDGTPIAEHLGLPTVRLDLQEREISENELFFLAPSAGDPELIFHHMAREIGARSEAAVLFSGYGRLWDVDQEDTSAARSSGGTPLAWGSPKSDSKRASSTLRSSSSTLAASLISSPSPTPWRCGHGAPSTTTTSR